MAKKVFFKKLEKEVVAVAKRTVKDFKKVSKDETKHNLSTTSKIVDGYLIRVNLFKVV